MDAPYIDGYNYMMSASELSEETLKKMKEVAEDKIAGASGMDWDSIMNSIN